MHCFNIIKETCMLYAIETSVEICLKHIILPTNIYLYKPIHTLFENWTGDCSKCKQNHGGKCQVDQVACIIAEYLPSEEQCKDTFCGRFTPVWSTCDECKGIYCQQCLDQYGDQWRKICFHCNEFEQEQFNQEMDEMGY